MIFASYEFLFVFLPSVVAVYYLLPARGNARLYHLTLASYVFYGWWNLPYCLVVLGITVFDYLVGAGLVLMPPGRRRKTLLGASIVANLGLLAVFKYSGFLAETASGVVALFHPGQKPFLALSLLLPIGISFHTFQSMSYTIDVYRGLTRPARSFIEFACFVVFFPQLVAGPIVRYVQVADEYESRTHSYEKAARGIHFFVSGLAKKVLLADPLAPVAAGLDVAPDGALSAWAATLAYALQIYFDFSAYSDMAIGLAALFGFDFPPNFDSPYKSRSISEFWRRWHISLSGWLRDYLYITLGGSQRGTRRTYLNLSLTMVLGGLWHGASWNFVLWGAYHGALLAGERALGTKNPIRRLPAPVQVMTTLILVSLGWVLFRAPTLQLASGHLRAMLGLGGLGTLAPLLRTQVPMLSAAVIVVALLVALFGDNTWRRSVRLDGRRAMLTAALATASILVLIRTTAAPFLYFQF